MLAYAQKGIDQIQVNSPRFLGTAAYPQPVNVQHPEVSFHLCYGGLKLVSLFSQILVIGDKGSVCHLQKLAYPLVHNGYFIPTFFGEGAGTVHFTLGQVGDILFYNVSYMLQVVDNIYQSHAFQKFLL